MSHGSWDRKDKKKEVLARRKWKLQFLKSFVKKHPEVSITLVCKTYNIASSTLYYKQKQRITDRITETKVQLAHIFDPYYGYRRISYKLNTNKKKIQRIMQICSIKAYTRKRKFRKPWDTNFAHMWVENLKKHMRIIKKNQVWSSDFTHLYYGNIEFYLATVIDEYSRKIVGYKLWLSHEKSLVIETVQDAIWKTKISPDILHSDQGSEYRSYEYLDTLKNYGITVSMSAKSSPWENATQESLYWKLKLEIGNLNRFKTFEEAIEAIHLYIYYYNNDRIHTSLKMSPNKFLAKCKNTAKSV